MKSRIFIILLLCTVFVPFGFAQQTNSSAQAAPSADQTAPHKEPLQPAKVTSLELLGFQRDAKDAPVHAAAIAFQLKGCEDKGYDFKYCDYVREQDETLRLIFWRDELENVKYQFGVKHYNSLLKELSAKYGSPRSDEWGGISEGASLSLVERADHTGGVATLHFNGGKFDEYRKKAFPLPQKPSDIPSQALPEINRAERRLFGKRTDEVESLSVQSETLQGTLAVTTHCEAHNCDAHNAAWIVDLSTGQAAGALEDKSEITVYLGDYESREKLPPVLANIEKQRTEGPSPKRVRYVSQIQ